MVETNMKFPPRRPATREELFITTQQAMFSIKETLDKISSIVNAENQYLEQAAAEMGIQKYHLK